MEFDSDHLNNHLPCGVGYLCAGVAVIPRRRDPGAAQAWLLFMFLFPWLGLLLFLLIGNPKLPPHRRARQRQIDERLAQVIARDEANPALRPVFDHEVDPQRQPIASLIQQLGGLPVLDGNTVELLAQYDATIDRIVDDIDQATTFVHLLMYIFADDATGERVADALSRASVRGVTCRVLMDSLGSRNYLRSLFPKLRAAGVEVRTVLPLRLFGKGFTRPDLRNHRKIVIVDGQVGFTGSQNLVDTVFKPGRSVYEELVARVSGPVVAQLQAVVSDRLVFRNQSSCSTRRVAAQIAADGAVGDVARRCCRAARPTRAKITCGCSSRCCTRRSTKP